MKFFKNLYKLFSVFLIFVCINTYVFADDISPTDDVVDMSEILSDIGTLETNSDTSQIPTINSRAYVVIDRNSNTVLIGKNENQRKKMASTTKIMTAMIVIENSNLSDTVEVSKKAASTGGSRLGLKTGDKLTVLDLLYGLMMRSGNDSAVALAEHVAGSITGFAELMNKKAETLGLSNYAMNNEIFAQIVGTKNYTITINGYPKSLTNTNELLGVLNGVYGIKTGFTNGANRCLVTCCKRGDMDIICVVLGADTKKYRTTDSIKLIEYAFSNFTYVNIDQIISEHFESWKRDNLTSFKINKGISNKLDLQYENPQYPIIPIRNDLINNLDILINCNFIYCLGCWYLK